MEQFKGLVGGLRLPTLDLSSELDTGDDLELQADFTSARRANEHLKARLREVEDQRDSLSLELRQLRRSMAQLVIDDSEEELAHEDDTGYQMIDGKHQLDDESEHVKVWVLCLNARALPA